MKIQDKNELHHVDCVLLLCSINKRYDEMAERLNEMPETTEALVELQEYLQKASYLLTSRTVYCTLSLDA